MSVSSITKEASCQQLNDFENELLKKIEIGIISRQLKSKLASFSKKNKKPSVAGKVKKPTYGKFATTPNRLASDLSINTSSGNSYRGNISTSPLFTPKATRAGRSGGSAATSSSPATSEYSRVSPLRKNRKSLYQYNSLDYMVSSNGSDFAPSTPKYIKPSRAGDEEGANLLMLLATSPNNNQYPNSQKKFQSISSPVRGVPVESFLPATPAFKSFSSPRFLSNDFLSTLSPSKNPLSSPSGLPSGLLRTPKFNISDYVNFPSPSPRQSRISTNNIVFNNNSLSPYIAKNSNPLSTSFGNLHSDSKIDLFANKSIDDKGEETEEDPDDFE